MIEIPKISFIGYLSHDINITPEKTTRTVGGGVYYSAMAASFITNPVGLISRIDPDFDTSVLRDEISPGGIIVDQRGITTQSTQTYVSEDDLTNRLVSVEFGVSKFLTGEDIPYAWIEALRILHLAPMLPEQQNAILKYIRRKFEQIKISIDTDISFLGDPQNVAIIQDSYANTDIGFVNRREYQVLKATIDQMPEAVIKLDKEGAAYKRRGKIISTTSAREVKVVDATGAGDVLAGTFLALQLLSLANHEALKMSADRATSLISEKNVRQLFNPQLS